MPLDTDEAISYCRAPPRGGKKRLAGKGWGGPSGGAGMGEVAHIAGTPLPHVLFIDSKQIRSVYSSSRASSSSQITWSSFSYPSFQGYTFPFRDVYGIIFERVVRSLLFAGFAFSFPLFSFSFFLFSSLCPIRREFFLLITQLVALWNFCCYCFETSYGIGLCNWLILFEGIKFEGENHASEI